MNKFQPLDAYRRGKGETYKLLPLKFTPLDDSKYVVTNMAGEYHILARDALHAFVQKQLNTDSADYDDLKAKHFLIDSDSDVAVDLLALKVRTKYQRLSNFTGLHLFVVTLRCEHSCPYCQVSRQNDGQTQFDMSPEIAAKVLSLVFRSPSPNIKIEFQGGEPLLNFDLIKFIVRRASDINQVERRDLAFVIATNLSVVTDDMLEFCREYSIHISTSLDGPADLHNKNRPRPGNDSYQRAIAGINRVRDALGRDSVSAVMTTTATSLTRVRDIIDEYVSDGFHGIFLRPLSPYGFAIKTKWYAAYDHDKWLDFYFEGLDYVIELNRKGWPFREFYAATILAKMLTPFQPGFVDLMSPAGIGIGALAYNYDGNVFASDESRMLAEMHDNTFLLGNVQTNTYEQIILSNSLLNPLEASFTESVPMCSDCAFEPFCGADPVYHHATQGDFVGRKPLSGFCNRNMAIFKGLISRMEADTTTRELFYQWASR
ncbi:MAG TPA: His-Xaa-Ser system radical SAM maturase HxsB [Rhizomicrobium sp.]|jgi:His-Xaa-Ser system radical SAM maturase HxsB|nr:His-Xaa-Ser system radical SAM maturase HxsB [Rhizomicrobium sp.]